VISSWTDDTGRSSVGSLLVLALVGVGGFWVFHNSDWIANGINGRSTPGASVAPAILPPPAAGGTTASAPAASRKAKTAAPRRPTRGSEPAFTAPVDSTAPARPIVAEPVPRSEVVYGVDDADVVPPAPLRKSQMVDALPPGVPARRAVVIELLIDDEGLVEKALRLSPRNPINDAVAVSAAKGLRFRPGTKDGQAIRYRKVMWYVIPE
jgi:hypothetical protein